MHYETKTLDTFFIIGLAVRTTNAAQQSQKDISELWQTFFSKNAIAQIPNKTNNDIYCVYTNYESDANGFYTTLLGCKVATLQIIPQGFAGITINGATYQVYKSVGKLPDSVLATWNHIWQTPIARNYVADFDLYSDNAQDPNYTEVMTFVSIHA
jgi:predicted transcriptional regulator YdeE